MAIFVNTGAAGEATLNIRHSIELLIHEGDAASSEADPFEDDDDEDAAPSEND